MNTKSSTESKVGVVSDYLSYNMYMKLIEHSIPRQPEWNKAKENGKKSCTDKSRHVYIRYCSLKDLVDSNNMTIAYYSTENVLADFFTKNLLEELFLNLCYVIMVYEIMDTLQMGPPPTK